MPRTARAFVGAGLYDSFSGCLLDDLDGDTKGPCKCDPTESKERGVFRAIRKAYASFYNDNGFLERLRHGIDESQVAMGLLVHYSAPDETEMANGVAKVYYESPNRRQPILAGDLVTQAGRRVGYQPRYQRAARGDACHGIWTRHAQSGVHPGAPGHDRSHVPCGLQQPLWSA